MGCRRPGAGHRAGGRQQRRADARPHEPRGAAAYRAVRPGGVLEPFAAAPLGEGRGVGPSAAGARDPHRLRQRCGAAEGDAARARARHRLPHRTTLVLLPARRGRRLAQRRAGAERPCHHLRESPMSGVAPPTDTLARLAAVIESRRGGDPDKSYVARLFAKGPDAILKKIGEEATETVMAAKDGVPRKIIYEVADLWFHTLVLLAHKVLKPADVLNELARREGLSGLAEKANRHE